MNEEHPFDLLPGYALNCLDVEDNAVAVEHLSHCELCRSELQHLENLVAILPDGMTLFDPPADLRDRIMVQALAKSASRTVYAAPPPEVHLAAGIQASPLGRPPSRTTQDVSQTLYDRIGGLVRSLSPKLAWAGLALIVLLALSNAFLLARSIRSSLQPGLRAVALTSPDADSAAEGTLVISDDGEYGVLVVDRLPALEQDQQYQLWLIRDGKRTSGGVFSVNPEGYGTLLITSPDPLISYQSIGITLEPAGGSPGPTGPKVLGGDL